MSETEIKAHDVVRKYMYWSVGAGLIPLPLIDLAAISAIQLKMVASLAKVYNQKFAKDAGKAFVGALVGSTLTTTGYPLGSAVKMIPLVGQTAGAVTVSAVAGASTYAVGKVFIQHFESGGTFLDFNPEKVREHYAQEFESAKVTPK